MNKSCMYMVMDGAGTYCRIVKIPKELDYPHQFKRTDCHGKKTFECPVKGLIIL